MKADREEFIILKKIIEKYCEEKDKKKLFRVLEGNRFEYKYLISEFSKLKIPSKMTTEELKEYEEKIMRYI